MGESEPTVHRVAGEVVHYDCRHFVGDRPCVPHKLRRVRCATCAEYDPVAFRILIVKLGAMGDVLRTTSLLPALLETYPSAAITWLTAPESVGLLAHNPRVDRVLAVGAETLARLLVEEFDLVLCPEAAPEAAALAGVARAPRKQGFGLAPAGHVFPYNLGAEELFHTGLFDDAKQANRKTYEQLLCEVAELPWGRHRPSMHLTDAEQRFAAEFQARHGLAGDRRVVGINTGGGGRWQHKRWTIAGFTELASRLAPRDDIQVVLLGGPEEVAVNRLILEQSGAAAIDAGCDNSVRQFAALIGACDVLLTGDTLALHLALARGTRLVALFGPTSAVEIDCYDLGEKIVTPAPCANCYLTSCAVTPHCMEQITVDQVFDAVMRQLAALEEKSG